MGGVVSVLKVEILIRFCGLRSNLVLTEVVLVENVRRTGSTLTRPRHGLVLQAMHLQPKFAISLYPYIHLQPMTYATMLTSYTCRVIYKEEVIPNVSDIYKGNAMYFFSFFCVFLIMM